MIAFASSLDQAGPMARSAEDCAVLLNNMAGFDSRDATSLDRTKEDYTRDLEQPLAGLRIGLPKEYFSRRTKRGSWPGGRSGVSGVSKIGCGDG